MKRSRKIAIIGAGNGGQAISAYLASKGVTLKDTKDGTEYTVG